MVKNNVWIIFFSLFFTSLAYAATFTVYNVTDRPLEVTARWGTGSAYETTTLLENEKYTFSAFLQNFYELVWRSTNEGVYYTLDIRSTRFMTDGAIEIRPNGRYVINFNQNGVYQFPQIERGVSPFRKGYPTG